MKNDVSSSTIHTTEIDLSKQIAKTVQEASDSYQAMVGVHPLISNYRFHQVNKVLENERFNTIVQLARVMNDEEMSRVIKALSFSITVP